MNSIQFAPERHLELSSLSEAYAALGSDFRMEETFVPFDQLMLTDSLTFQIKEFNRELRPTLTAFTNALKPLGISLPLASRLSRRLLQEVFDELKSKSRVKTFRLFTRQNVLVNIAHDASILVSNSEALNILDNLTTKFSIEKLWIGDRGVRAFLVDPNLELRPSDIDIGDIAQIGLNVESSETGFGWPTAEALIFRLRCRNGAVVSCQWGQAAFEKPRQGLNHREALEQFERRLTALSFDLQKLTYQYKLLYHACLLDTEFEAIWRSLRHIIGSTKIADKMIEIEPDKRCALLQTLKERRKLGRFRPEPTDLSAFEIFNRVTDSQTVRFYPLPVREALERLGGTIIGMVAGRDEAYESREAVQANNKRSQT
jgi:hypothetical protein